VEEGEKGSVQLSLRKRKNNDKTKRYNFLNMSIDKN